MNQENSNDGAAEGEYFALPSLLDLAAAPALFHAIRQHVTVADSVVLDGHVVERVSTPCLQILLATAMDAHARGISFRLREPSPALTNAIAELGLTSSFEH